MVHNCLLLMSNANNIHKKKWGGVNGGHSPLCCRLRAAWVILFFHQSCAVDCSCMSRRNHVSELFLDWTKHWVTHFDVEVRLLECFTFHENVEMDIGGHHRRHQETKHECGCFVAFVACEKFRAVDECMHEVPI